MRAVDQSIHWSDDQNELATSRNFMHGNLCAEPHGTPAKNEFAIRNFRPALKPNYYSIAFSRPSGSGSNHVTN